VALTITSKTTKEQIASELRALQAKHDQFRKDVAQAALDAKDSEGWCSEGFREAMDNLGLIDLIPSNKRLVTLKVVVDAAEQGYDTDYLDEDGWAEAALSSIRYSSPGDLHGYDVEDAPQDK
jgi:hypothetical protein